MAEKRRKEVVDDLQCDEIENAATKRAAISFDAFRFVPDETPGGVKPIAERGPLDRPVDKESTRKVVKQEMHAAKPEPKEVEVRLMEKYRTANHLELPLRLLFVGHNPSDHAWASRHYYSNPVNRFWPLLRSTGIIPSTFTAEDDDNCPEMLGIGLTDVGHGSPGTNSNAFTSADFVRWRGKFFARLRGHIQRAAHTAGCPVEDAAPRIIAFTGKRQWQELFLDKKQAVKNLEYGVQSARPVGWPKEARQSVVFVLTSPSGAAALTNEDREAPYRQLSALLQAYPWPDPRKASILSCDEHEQQQSGSHGEEKEASPNSAIR